MKFDRQKTYPHPVLRPHSDDFVNSEFQASVIPSFPNDEEVCFSFDMALSEGAIVDLIKNQQAHFVSIVSCRDTYTREIIKSYSRAFSKSFRSDDYAGEISVNSYVVASAPVDKYWSNNFNTEFSGSFSLKPGDLLAEEEPRHFFFDREAFKPITTIFDLVKNDNLSGGAWRVDTTSERISIEVSPKMKECIGNHKSSKEHRAIWLNSLYFSAVLQVLTVLKNEPDIDEGWAKTINNHLMVKGEDLTSEEPYILAQRLLGDPLNMMATYVFREE
jgi:hypothetical protein